MQIQKGRFFTYLPSAERPRELNFTFKGLFRDPEEQYLVPMREFTGKPVIVPHFCMAEQQIASYCEEVGYQRNQSLCTFRTLVPFTAQVELLPMQKAQQVRLPGSFQLPDEWLHEMTGTPWQLQLTAGGFSMTLENSVLNKDEQGQEELYYEDVAWLSVKQMLDPEDGLERLLADVAQKKSAGFVPVKLAKLLEIIRVAQPDEERVIMANVYRDDKPLWNIFQKCLHSQELLHYMNKAEVFSIVQHANEQEIASIQSLPQTRRNVYAAYFSKRRWADIQEQQTKSKEDLLWQRILKHYEEKYITALEVQGASGTFYPTSAPSTGLIRETYAPGLLAEPGPWQDFSYSNQQLQFALPEGLKEMHLYIETLKFTLRKVKLKNAQAGTHQFGCSSLRRLFFAAIDYENKFHEGIAINMARYIK